MLLISKLQISLPIPTQVEERCYKRQPLGLEAKSHNRDTHTRAQTLQSPIKQTNKQTNKNISDNLRVLIEF